MTVALVPSTAPQVIEGWFTTLYRYCDGWITVFSIDKETGARFVDWAKTDRPDEIAAIAVERAARCDVWYGVATRKEPLGGNKRGGAADCLHIPALWADIDILGPGHSALNLPPDLAAAQQLLADYPLAPTVTVHSGHGLQPLWVLAEPLNAQEAAGFLEGWTYTWIELAARRGWHLDNVWDVARVMRVPGTQNRKHDPVEVTILEINKGQRYGLDDLDGYTLEQPVKEPTKPTVAYIGPQRPGDAFNAVRSGAEILEAAGFALERTDSNGDRHYHVPGAANDTGATVYAEDGHTTIWSETATARWPTLQLRRPYDAFGLYSHLNHRGDWRTASDELARQGYGSKHVADLPPILASPDQAEEGDGLLRRLSMPELLAMDRSFQWTARGLMVHPTYGIIGGEEKTLKTYTSIAFALGIAAGVPIFDNFPVDKPAPVMIYVGEGGRVPFTRRLERVADAMGITLADIPLHVSFDIASLASLTFQATLARDLSELRPRLVVIDPMYAFHGGSTSGGSLFEEGELLTKVSAPCLNANSSLIIVTHFNRGSSSGLRRITMAGGAEWADSWWFLSHRETPDVDNGRFRLLLEVGSRQWGGSTWDLDLNVGTFDPEIGEFDGDLNWELARHVGGVGGSDRIEEVVIDILEDEPWELTKSQLVDRVGGNKARARAAIEALKERERIVSKYVKRPENGVLKARELWAPSGEHFDPETMLDHVGGASA